MSYWDYRSDQRKASRALRRRYIYIGKGVFRIGVSARIAREELGIVKLTFCLRRLPQISRQEFQAHWIGPHREIMIRHKAALGYRRYAKGHTISGETASRIEGSRGGPEPYEGTAEVWYDDMESFERSLS